MSISRWNLCGICVCLILLGVPLAHASRGAGTSGDHAIGYYLGAGGAYTSSASDAGVSPVIGIKSIYHHDSTFGYQIKGDALLASMAPKKYDALLGVAAFAGTLNFSIWGPDSKPQTISFGPAVGLNGQWSGSREWPALGGYELELSSDNQGLVFRIEFFVLYSPMGASQVTGGNLGVGYIF